MRVSDAPASATHLLAPPCAPDDGRAAPSARTAHPPSVAPDTPRARAQTTRCGRPHQFGAGATSGLEHLDPSRVLRWLPRRPPGHPTGSGGEVGRENLAPSAQTDNESPAAARLNRRHGARTATDPGRHRHRRHVHRRRRLRRGHRRAGHHQDARRRPRNPADGFMAGIDKVLGLLGLPAGDDDRPRSATARPSPPTSCSRARSSGSASSPPRATSAMLEIARQSVPDGYGNSYFWVKPPTGSCPPTWSGPSAAGSTSPAPRCGPSTRTAPRAVARWFRDQRHRHARRLLPARLRQPRARGADARGAAPRSTPTRSCRSPARCCASTASTSAR